MTRKLTLSIDSKVISVGESIVLQSLNSDFRDFEDAIQNYSAASLPHLDGLVTRNTKDFAKSGLPVLTPTEALGIFR